MGCLRRLGCLVILLAAVVAGWLYRDRIVALWHRLRGVPAAAPVTYAAPAPGAAREGEGALERLARRGGPAYVDVTAAELASLIEEHLQGPGGRILDSVGVALGEQRVEVRGSLDVSAVPRRLLGPLAEGLGRREPVVAGGVLAARPDGRVAWTIDALEIRDFPFPRAVIPAILHAMNLTDGRDASVPIPFTEGVGDVRVSPSGIRLYRAAAR